jgi:2-iminobutanoate/2-iminopropanoate deaminase
LSNPLDASTCRPQFGLVVSAAFAMIDAFHSLGSAAAAVEKVWAMHIINQQDLPPPKGPFSYAVETRGLVFVSGHAATDLESGDFVLGDIRHETALTLRNIARMLERAGSGLKHVVKCSVFLRDIAEFSEMNEVYRVFFPNEDTRPARTTVQAVLGSGIRIEIDVIAEVPRA